MPPLAAMWTAVNPGSPGYAGYSVVRVLYLVPDVSLTNFSFFYGTVLFVSNAIPKYGTVKNDLVYAYTGFGQSVSLRFVRDIGVRSQGRHVRIVTRVVYFLCWNYSSASGYSLLPAAQVIFCPRKAAL